MPLPPPQYLCIKPQVEWGAGPETHPSSLIRYYGQILQRQSWLLWTQDFKDRAMTDASVLPLFSPCLWFLCFSGLGSVMFPALWLWSIGIFFMCVESTDIEFLCFEQLCLSVNVGCYRWMNKWMKNEKVAPTKTKSSTVLWHKYNF